VRPFDTLPTGQMLVPVRLRSKVSPTALRFAGRARALVLLACALPVCRLDDWGLLPFADPVDDSDH
jgi:hypothetical protein